MSTIRFAINGSDVAAEVAEIAPDRERGLIRVHAVWIAIDAGIIVNPDSVAAQMEGGTIMGLGPALYEQVLQALHA